MWQIRMFNVPTDKILHFAVGALISLGVTAAFNPIAGTVAALLAGCAKEWIWDAWLKRGDFDPWDAVATTAGGITVAALFTLARL